jgi:hypothetical protein
MLGMTLDFFKIAAAAPANRCQEDVASRSLNGPLRR